MLKFKLDVLIFFIFLLLFSFVFYNQGQLLYGDFGSTFVYNDFRITQEFVYSWLNSNFIGYESTFYSIIRVPFYLIIDTINILFGNKFFWLFFVIMYFLRYYLFSLFISEFNKDVILVTLISFIYSMNFYFIDRSGHILISFASVTIPLLIYSYNKLSAKITIKNLLILLFSLIIILTSMHVTLMTIYFFGIYLIFIAYNYYKNKKIKSFIANNSKIFIFLVFTLPYIYLPLIFSTMTSKSLNVIEQVGVQASGWIYELSINTTIVNTLSGTGFLYSFITEQPVILSINTLFVIGGIYIILNRKDKKEHSYYWVYLLIYLVFMFLSTRVLILKFIEILKSYLIGFNSVKDNSYFLLYQQFAFFTLLSIKIKDIINKKVIIVFLSVWSIFFIGVNIISFKNNDIFQLSNIPDSYYEINQHLPSNGRVLVLPLGWVTKFVWTEGFTSGFFNIFLANYEIVGQNIIEGPSINTQQKIKQLTDCFSSNCSEIESLIDSLSLRYIVLFKNAIDLSKDFNSNEKLSYDNNIFYLEDNKIINKIYEGEDYVIYEFNNNLGGSKIRSKNIQYTNINPTKYKLTIKNITEKQSLEFLESYHNNWKLYLNPTTFIDEECSIIQKYNSQDKIITECENNQKTNRIDSLGYIWKKSLFEDSHKIVYDYANQWTIDPDYIRSNFDKSMYRENPDGSIDVELTLYFQPQIYFYLGVLISGVSVGLSLLYLFYILFIRIISGISNKFKD
jgi:hypothetical protein